MSYTRSQENMTPKFQRFYEQVVRKNNVEVPRELCEEFRKGSKPLMPWCNVLTFDTRVGVLFLTTLLGVTWIYFLFEIFALEPLRFYVCRRHEKMCSQLEKKYFMNEIRE